MSIQQVQTKNLLELIAQSFFVNGINPQSNQLYSNLSDFFSKNPAGKPLSIDVNLFRQDVKSDPEMFNHFMAAMIVNMDVLYETCANHIDDIIMLNTILRTHLDRLKIKRKVLEAKIDDYLLGIYNSDGYFYSFSDSFSNTAYIDFEYTTAFIDTQATTASLPAISSLSQTMTPNKIATPAVRVTNASNQQLTVINKTDFANAIDGMTNTAWYFEVRTTEPETLTATVDIQLSTSLGDTTVTRIDLHPFGVSPVQCGINASFVTEENITYNGAFSNVVKTSADKMTFVGDQIENNIDRIILQLTKTEPDYVENTASSRVNVYMFGFKEILMTEQFYDPYAVLITSPFGIPDELKEEAVIDSVSLVTDDQIPTDTTLKYYVAADNTTATSLADFDWKQITPLSSEEKNGNVVNFSGSYNTKSIIRHTPRTGSDLKLIDLNTTNSDLAKRNPTPSYIAGVDTYRICAFLDEVLAGTMKLEEGINTTRIFYTELDEDAISEGFTFWKDKFDDPTSYSTTYGEIDSGHEFFYGADIGEDGKSVYAETFLETDREYPIFLKECRKSDSNSRSWDVRIFLNGREIANMPAGTDKITVPWKLKEGVNHIVVMTNIPEASEANPSPYIGTLNIMVGSNLDEFGIVKLDNWTYVDLYKFQNNQVNEPNSFTIYNNEIISRKRPTDNFRLTYKKQTSTSPENVRLRVDFARSSQYAKATPILDSYRVRFAYS